jgi:hypothetical protein
MKGIVVVPTKPVKRKRDRTQPANIYAPEDVRHECARCETLQAEIDRLREALEAAREDVAHWGNYASDYFKEKHDLDGDLARIDATLAKEAGQ